MNMGDPFVGSVPRKISKEELVQALRVDIAGELEAITVYDAHAMATDDPRAKAVLSSIRDEERQHVGELLHLMEILDPAEAQLLGKGKQEVDQLLTQQGHGQDVISAGQNNIFEQGPSHGLGIRQEINEARHPAMLTGSQAGGQQMPQMPGQSGQQMPQMPQMPGQSGQQMPHPQGQMGQEGLSQYHDFTYQPRPGNFGHRGPNQR